jgi:hypothetical protein
MGLRSGAPFGSGCDIRAQVSHRGRLVVWSATLPQSDKGRVARQPAAIAITTASLCVIIFGLGLKLDEQSFC